MGIAPRIAVLEEAGGGEHAKATVSLEGPSPGTCGRSMALPTP